jgi:hypothetical protein
LAVESPVVYVELWLPGFSVWAQWSVVAVVESLIGCFVAEATVVSAMEFLRLACPRGEDVEELDLPMVVVAEAWGPATRQSVLFAPLRVPMTLMRRRGTMQS